MSGAGSEDGDEIGSSNLNARSSVLPSFLNKPARMALAKETINKTIPGILRANGRARLGIEKAHMLRGNHDLPKIALRLQGADLGKPGVHVTMDVSVIKSDTLVAAQIMQNEHPGSKIAILNMASSLQPGGGVLRGAKAQEESLCMRTTLYPSLREEWYRLPDDAIIYSPDVLVFKSASPELRMLDANERFYVDVISCAAVRMPERDEEVGEDGVKRFTYANPKDEESMSLKMKYIMRAAAKMGVQRIVLGAFGCGAYGNPVSVVAKMMRRCILGRGHGRRPEEDWTMAGIEQVVIAILDENNAKKVWQGFADEFSENKDVHVEGVPASKEEQFSP